MNSNTRLIGHHIFWRGLYFLSVFVLNILIARYFAAENSGQIFYIINNLALGLLIVSISLESGATYYVSNGTVRAEAVARLCLIWAALASVVAITGWWLVLYITESPFIINPGFIIASFLFILGVLLSTFFTALFYAKKDFATPNKILLSINVLLLCGLIITNTHLIVNHYFLQIYFFSFFLQGLLIMILFFRKYAAGRSGEFPSRQILRKVLQYSLSALMANLIYFLVLRIDYWFVKYYCSSNDLGNYIQASKIAQMMLVVPAIMGASLFPLFTSGRHSGSINQLPVVVRLLLWMNAGLCLLLAGLGWLLLPFVFGSSFNSLYHLSMLLIPGILSVTVTYPLAAWFSATKRIRINLYGSLIALTIICVGDLIFIPVYGSSAASVMSSAGYFAACWFYIHIYRKQYPVTANELFILKRSDLRQIRSNFLQSARESEKIFIPNATP